MRKLQIYLTGEAEHMIDELERYNRISNPRGNLSRDISELLESEIRKHRKELDELRAKYGPAVPVIRPRGRAAKG